MLTDPTGGAGYSFGAVLPSAHMTSITGQLPYAIDGNGGGSYSPTGAINISDASGGGLGNVDVMGAFEITTSGFLHLRHGPTIADSDNQTLTPAVGIMQEFAVPAGTRNHDIVAAGNDGRCFIVRRPATGAFGIIIHRSGFAGAAIVTLPLSTWAAALLYDDGTNWRLGLQGSCTLGADA